MSSISNERAPFDKVIADIAEYVLDYGIKSELELISGNVSDLSKFHTVKKDKDDVMDRIGKHLTIKIQQHKSIFAQGLKSAEERREGSCYWRNVLKS